MWPSRYFAYYPVAPLPTEGSVSGHLMASPPPPLATPSFRDSFYQAFSMGAPTMVSHLFIMGNVFGSAIILSRLGQDVLAASTLIEMMQAIATDLGAAWLTPVGIKAGHHDERSDFSKAGMQLKRGWVHALIITGTIIPVFLFLEPILIAAGIPSAVAKVVQTYFHGFLPGLPATACLLVNRHWLNGLKWTWAPAIINGINFGMTIGFAYMLANGVGVIPALGPFGVGLANTIAVWPCFIASMVFIFNFRGFERMPRLKGIFGDRFPSLEKYFKRHTDSVFSFLFSLNQWGGIGSLMKMGIPMLVGALTDFSLLLTLNLLAGKFGEDVLTAQGIANEYMLIGLTLMLAVCEIVSILMERTLADKRPEQVRHFFISGLIMAGSVAAVGMLLLAAIPEKLFFLLYQDDYSDPELVNLFKTLALITGGILCLEVFRFVSIGSLIGVHDASAATKISLLYFIGMGIPALLVSDLVFNVDIVTLNIIRAAVIALCAVTMLGRWINESRLVIQLEKGVETPADPRGLALVLACLIRCFGKDAYAKQEAVDQATELQYVQAPSTQPLLAPAPS
jgi:multidrug resistance protein, MATE family